MNTKQTNMNTKQTNMNKHEYKTNKHTFPIKIHQQSHPNKVVVSTNFQYPVQQEQRLSEPLKELVLKKNLSLSIHIINCDNRVDVL